MRSIILLLILISCVFAEISISLGQTFGSYIQDIRDDHGHYQRKSVLAGRPALFYELDSGDHFLWFPNDRVAYGIAAFAETRHHDYVAGYTNTTYIPFYINYFLKLTEFWEIGAGINFNIMQLRYKNDTLNLGQQIGKNLLFRFQNSSDNFYEFGLMQTCASSRFDNEIDSFYDATNYVFKLGWYLEQNTF